ncbi:unnamed protein product [Lasius platythorax]|uniref:Uncharacterized protein n=1 Tax=Lasius platythorax TaxID=488582 RepID=A0AAV2MY41_9HYME
MSFDESIFKTFENKRKVLNNIFAKLIEPNGEKKTQFNPSTSNKLDNLIKSPEQPVILKKYEHTENKSCPVKMSPNNIEDQSCDLDLFINKNWQENIEMNELDCLNLDFNIDDVSNFIEMPSNDVESYLDSDLLAIENWRGKVNVNNNFDYDDFNKESVNDHIVSDIAPSLTGSRELEMINIKSSNKALLDHSYSSMNSSITDLVSPIINQQNNNFIESKSNLKGESESNYIPSTHLVSGSKEESQAYHHKSKKISKYFKAYPEVSQINALIGQRKKSALLPHGSLLPPIRIKENKGEINSYFVTNTCPFDSLIYVLMTGAIDINYQAFLKASSNPTLQLVYNLVQKGVTQYVLRQRILILKNYYNCTPQVQTDLRIVSYMIDAFDNIANVTKISWTQSLVYRTRKNAPNHKIIAKEGFSSLEKALSFRSPIYKIRCCDPCLGKYTLFREPRIHIFIELDIRPNIQCKIGLNCRVEQLPTTLKFQYNDDESFEYRLAGVIAYISGHYIAYCLRSNGIWQIYDDLRADIHM